jgi:hypothetical protein
MGGSERRRELRAQYEERAREAGVYLVRNTASGRVLVASSPDLASVRNRLEFGKATGSAGVVDRRLAPDARELGMGAFELEVLDHLEVAEGATAAEIGDDLKALEALWREKLAETPQY